MSFVSYESAGGKPCAPSPGLAVTLTRLTDGVGVGGGQEYVAYRTKMALGKVPDIVSTAIHDVLASEEWKRNVLRSITKAAATELANSRPTFAGADPHCVGAVGHKSGARACECWSCVPRLMLV